MCSYHLDSKQEVVLFKRQGKHTVTVSACHRSESVSPRAISSGGGAPAAFADPTGIDSQTGPEKPIFIDSRSTTVASSFQGTCGTRAVESMRSRESCSSNHRACSSDHDALVVEQLLGQIPLCQIREVWRPEQRHNFAGAHDWYSPLR